MWPFLSRRSNSETVTREVLLDSYLFKNFTRMSKSEFEFLLNATDPRITKKRYEYEKRHTDHNRIGDYTTFCGQWRFVQDFNVPLQSTLLFYMLHSTGSLWSTDRPPKGVYQGKLNSFYWNSYTVHVNQGNLYKNYNSLYVPVMSKVCGEVTFE
jgi:hypothetical protein